MSKAVIFPSMQSAEFPSLGPKERLNEARLCLLLKGVEVTTAKGLLELTWREALDIASDSEVTRKSLQVWDIAWERFMKDEGFFLKLSEHLERREQYFHLLSKPAETVG